MTEKKSTFDRTEVSAMCAIWSNPGGCRIPRCTTPVALIALLLIGLCTLLPSGVGAAAAPTLEIRSLDLVEMGPDARIVIQANGPLVWTTYRNSAVELVLELPESLPLEEVGSFETAAGLVESVEVEKLVGKVNSTRLVIRTRVEAEHTVVTDPGSLRLDLIAVSPQLGFESESSEEPSMEQAGDQGAAVAVDRLTIQEPGPEQEVAAEMTAAALPSEPQESVERIQVSPAAAATELRGVEVSFAAGRTKIWVLGDGEFYFSTFQLESPARFVIDLIGVVNQAPVSAVSVENDLIKQVRVAQFKTRPEPVARVVIDLFEAGEAEVESLSDGLVISFGAAVSNPSSAGLPKAAAVRETDTVVEALREQAEISDPNWPEEPFEAEAPVAVSVLPEPLEPMAAEQVELEPIEENAALGPDVDASTSLVDEPALDSMETQDSMGAQDLGGATPATSIPAMDASPLPEIFLNEIGEVEAAAPQIDDPEPGNEQIAEVATAAQVEDAWIAEIESDEERAATTDESQLGGEEIEIATVATDSAPEEDLIAAASAAYDEQDLIAQAEPAFESIVEETISEVDVLAAVEEEPDPTVIQVGGGADAFSGRKLGGGERVYQGAPMTLSLKDSDIKDILRSFAKISGLNVVVQPSVSGTVTVELTQVPWDQALEQILKINGLGYELEGNIMRIAPIAQLRAEAEERQRLVAAQALSVPLTTIIKRVSYADAVQVAGLLRSGGAASLMSQRGSVQVDTRTNTLIIKELPTFLDTVLAVIEHLDTPEPQVMIEARIIETTKRFSRSLGVEWDVAGVADAAHGNTTGLVFPNNGTVEGGVSLLTGAANGFLDISLGNILSTFQLDATLHAAESEGLINILSAPRITTLNNERASIQSGLQIPIQTVANNTVSVQFVNATLRLDVTPHVTAEGTVLMDINIQKREPQLAFAVVGATNAPIATKDARTRVIVRDGGTTVIGGIYKVTSDQGEDRVPGLANVPLIKHLFKNKRRSDENEELLIFITPRVTRL